MPGKKTDNNLRSGEARFVRYSEINPWWVNREMHLHTNYTDGASDVLQVIQQAEKIGLAEIAFTEHVRADSEWFPRFAEEIRHHAKESSVSVLVGAEARIKDFSGSLDISPSIRKLCDIVIGSVHRFPDTDGARIEFKDIPRKEFVKIEYELALGFIRRGEGDVLGHPGGMSMRHVEEFPDELYLSLMQEASATGVAVEINSSYLKNLQGYLALLERTDPLISLGSDAHKLSQLGECRNKLKAILWKD